jgi:hypothetical protein
MASQPAHGHVGGPAPEVGPGRLGAVAAVDEAQVERCPPVRRDRWGSPHDAHDDSSEPAPSTVRRQKGRVSMRPVAPVDDLVVVVVPPRLVLLRAVVVVDAEQHGPGGSAAAPR